MKEVKVLVSRIQIQALLKQKGRRLELSSCFSLDAVMHESLACMLAKILCDIVSRV